MLLTLCHCYDARTFAVDATQCIQSTSGMLGCDWRGAGDYVGTNLKFNTLVFRRFFKSGFLHVFKSPALRIIEIQDGDATCGNIDAPDHVKVFLSTELCKKVRNFFRAQNDMNIDRVMFLCF